MSPAEKLRRRHENLWRRQQGLPLLDIEDDPAPLTPARRRAIESLRRMTVENGCTPAEAAAARARLEALRRREPPVSRPGPRPCAGVAVVPVRDEMSARDQAELWAGLVIIIVSVGAGLAAHYLGLALRY